MKIGVYSQFRQGYTYQNYLAPYKVLSQTKTKEPYLMYLDNGIPALHNIKGVGFPIILDICKVTDVKVLKWAKEFKLEPIEIETEDNETVILFCRTTNDLGLSLISRGMIDE